jgi:lipopolysaccharide heptosyltransferase II
MRDWSTATNLLCVRLDALGDVLMTTPALRALKNVCPGRRITLLASPSGAEVAALVPEIDEVIVYSPPWMKATLPLAGSAGEYAMAEALRRRGFDAAAIFTVFTQSALPAAFLCHLAGIPRRAAHCRENPYQLLTDWVVDDEALPQVRHEVERQLALAAALGAPVGAPAATRLSLRVPAAARDRACHWLHAKGIDPAKRWAVLHPGASAPSRRYPPELFADAAEQIARQLDCQLVFTGSAEEHELIEGIRRGLGVASRSLAGELTLAELAGLIEQAPLVVCNNTGPAHIAAALGTPVVDLYALTNPQHTPWQVAARVLSHDVPCRHCLKSICPQGHHACLRRVSPADVARAAGELLAEAEAAPIRNDREGSDRAAA